MSLLLELHFLGMVKRGKQVKYLKGGPSNGPMILPFEPSTVILSVMWYSNSGSGGFVASLETKRSGPLYRMSTPSVMPRMIASALSLSG